MKNTEGMKALADKMDLELPQYYLEVARYELVGNQIVIKSIKVLDDDGKFLKFADNEKLINHIHEYPIRFKPYSND
jgi:hypothetical protein